MPASATMTISGPFGQYTTEAVVDEGTTFSCAPAAALIELGLEPARVVRVRTADGSAGFRQLCRALVTVAGVEDVLPVMFGEAGSPPVIGLTTLSALLLRVDETGALVPASAWA